MILDIDHFKQINDTYGHPAGNHVLAQFAATLTAYAHTFFDASAFKIYRYGGEEIVLIINEQPTNLNQFLTTLQKDVTFIKFNNQQIAITFSIGISFTVNHLDNAKTFLKADRLLYHVKEHGKNAYLSE